MQLLYEDLKTVNEGTDSSVLESSLQISFSAQQCQEKNFDYSKAMPKLFLPELRQTEKHFCETAGEFWVMIDE